ncbi:ankyrin repeat domain-containing protein [Lysobacter sp. CA196]|uniref:ankyrin repeat domain-containing protein n=1 Tax=Lysobacter sp. CA196 TaxID=3455606 RepID=UPI003F8D5EEA
MILLLALPAVAFAAEPVDTVKKSREELTEYLFEAARSGDAELIRSLAKNGVDLDARNAKGFTPLILATYHGRDAAIQALLQAGASPNVADGERGNTALMGALFRGADDAVRRLLDDPRTEVNQRNSAGQTAAMYAALFSRDQWLDALAKRGADFGLQDDSGADAEQLARRQGSVELAERLSGLAKDGRSPGESASR